MLYGDALKIIGGLSHPSKMPWWSWSISAADCITGSQLAKVPGTVCSYCYALKGRYLFPNVKTAHDRRKRAFDDPQFEDAFVLVLNTLYEKTRKRKMNGERENRFRWFDSGDIQSVEMLESINKIAFRTPQINHWLPTREIQLVKDYFAAHNTLSNNLIVRISSAKVGVTPKGNLFGLPISTVGCGASKDVQACPAAAYQGNRCLDCDACWTNSHIDYPLH